MRPLNQDDCRSLLSAVETIYGTMSLEQFPSRALTAVKQILSCNTICYNEVTLPASMTSWITEPAGAMPGPLLRGAFMRNLPEHPVLGRFLQRDCPSLKISDFLSHEQFHKLALYNEYYRKIGVEYQLLAAISTGRRQSVGLGLDRDRLDYSDVECLRLDLLRPHLVQAYRNVQALDLMKQVIEGTDKKLLMVSRSGEVRLGSYDVRHMIARFFDTSRFQSRLPDMLDRWIAYERSHLEDESDVPSPSIPLTINKRDRKLTVRFIWGGKNAEQDILLLEEGPNVHNTGLENEAGLTGRETEILGWLSQGKTNAEIGQALSISPRTVKKHLENMYRKLKVHGRGTAVARFYHL